MRIDRLDLIAYGHFFNKTLDFTRPAAVSESTLSSGPGERYDEKREGFSSGDLHLIYGPNEAGKSTALRALKAWLYGIPARTPDGFITDYKNLRLGGMISRSDGRALEFIRRKSRQQSLRYPGDKKILSEEELAAFVPVSELDFSRLWGISYESLVAGGKELFLSSGELSKALSAASGFADIRQLSDQLEQEAKEIFVKGGSVKKLNKALNDYQKSRSELKKLNEASAQWPGLNQEIEELDRQIEDLDQDIKKAQARLSQLERIDRIHEPLREHQSLHQIWLEIKDAAQLPQDFTSELQDLLNKKSNAEAHLRRSADEKRDLEKEIQGLSLREDILVYSSDIQCIKEDMALVRGSEQGKLAKMQRRDELHARIVALGQATFPSRTLEAIFLELDTWRSVLINQDLIRELYEEDLTRGQERKSIEDQLRDHKLALKDLERKIQSSPFSQRGHCLEVGLAPLKAMVSQVFEAGNLEDQILARNKKITEIELQCHSELSALKGYSGTLKDLSAYTLPPDHEVKALGAKYEKLRVSIQKDEAKIDALRGDRQKLDAELGSLNQKHASLPERKDLEKALNRRDDLWQQIKEVYLNPSQADCDPAKLVVSKRVPHTPETIKNLITQFDDLLSVTDNLAKRLYEQASAVQKKTDLIARMKDLSREEKAINQKLRLTKAQRKAWEKDWQELWAGFSWVEKDENSIEEKPRKIRHPFVEPQSPPEMTEWVYKYQSIKDQLRGRDEHLSEVDRLSQLMVEQVKILEENIALLSPGHRELPSSLGGLKELWRKLLEVHEGYQRDHERLQDSRKEQIHRGELWTSQSEELAQQQSDWQSRWQDALQLPSGERCTELVSKAPREVLTFLGAIEEMVDIRRECRQIDQELDHDEQIAERFSKDIKRLCAQLKISTDRNVRPIAHELIDSLAIATDQQTTLKEKQRDLQDKEKELRDHQEEVTRYTEQILEWQCSTGVETVTELKIAGEKSSERRDISRELKKKREELARSGEGRSIEELWSECRSVDLDTLQDALSAGKVEVEVLMGQRDDKVSLRAEKKAHRDSINGGGEACEVSQRMMEHTSRIQELIEEYIRLQTAALVLRQHVDHFRENHGAPVLRRAGEIFSRLTLGSFEGIRSLSEHGEHQLVGLREGRELTPAMMSTGTRDQLFLSLRLALIDHHLAIAEPVPFTVDDVLMSFDDARMKICLEVLYELSQKTQVLIFTHHQSILQAVRVAPYHVCDYDL